MLLLFRSIQIDVDFNLKLCGQEGRIVARLRYCAENLSRWNKMVLGQIPKQIQEKMETFSTLVCKDRNGSLGGEINMLRNEINELLNSEEIKWH